MVSVAAPSTTGILVPLEMFTLLWEVNGGFFIASVCTMMLYVYNDDGEWRVNN